jgi:charged multivesicular body protein 3
MAMKSVRHFFYGPTPEERVRAWQQKLRTESRRLDREISQLTMATDKARKSVKQLATKGDTKSARTLAKEVVRSNKQRDRLHVSKARLGSINMQLSHQLAMAKVTGSLQKSTEIMKLSNSLVKIPQLSATMREMSMEMMKAGIMEEMMEETLETLDDEEIEEEADEEVEKVLFDITEGKLGQAGSAKTELPAEQEEEEETEEEMQRMRNQLEGLLNG